MTEESDGTDRTDETVPGQRKALLTGATSGIGSAIRQRLLADGWSVIAVARRAQELESHPLLVPEVLDLSKTNELPDRLGEVASRHPRLDALILSAGRGRFGTLDQFSYQQIRELVDLNFLANAFLCRAFIHSLRSGGHAVFIGSEAALEGGHSGAAYSASKFALRGFAQALRKELATSGGRVTLINPGMVAGPFFDELDFEPGPERGNRLSPEDVAEAVLLALDQPAHAVIDEINLSPLKRTVRKKPKK